MLKTNEYFEGKVKSIALTTSNGDATIGVMEKGEYEFSTSRKETMEVVSGSLNVLLPGKENMETFSKGEIFKVKENQKFKVTVEEETAYICYYK